ncbi:MAG TPA: phosphoribosylglycinamide formyltransferase [Stellaceae bacterium]|nr:phosphoribosylglycinamide formyltransferase [Stellaceae bacterium]
MARLKVGVLISGRGSNLEALIAACAAPGFPAEIALVLSNRADAAGLAHAARAGIASRVIPHRDFSSRNAFDDALDGALAAAGIELVCLAGFMRLLGAAFVARWRDRLVNIHPSLLPEFPGLDTHARALAAGMRFSGCTVHFVRPEMDSGPIIVQAAVPVLPGDDAECLAARVLEAEHRAYPLALRLIAEGRVRVEGECVTIAGSPV